MDAGGRPQTVFVYNRPQRRLADTEGTTVLSKCITSSKSIRFDGARVRKRNNGGRSGIFPCDSTAVKRDLAF